MSKNVNKRFPANVALEQQTFLNNKKINGELYAILQSYSYPDGLKRTVVKKENLPKQKELCAKIGVSSPKTLRSKLEELKKAGYIIEDDTQYILPELENIFMYIPLETIRFLVDTMTENVVKIYIYLGQRYQYKHGYVFTIAEIADHVGIKLDNNARNYQIINNALTSLYNNGLIDYVEFYENSKPCKRLIKFSFEYNKKI